MQYINAANGTPITTTLVNLHYNLQFSIFKTLQTNDENFKENVRKTNGSRNRNQQDVPQALKLMRLKYDEIKIMGIVVRMNTLVFLYESSHFICAHT